MEKTNVTLIKKEKSITPEYLEKQAMRLLHELVKFNKTVRLLSKGSVHGLGEMDDIYHRTVISCDGEGVIHLDLRTLGDLDFANQAVLLAENEQNIPEPKIWR